MVDSQLDQYVADFFANAKHKIFYRFRALSPAKIVRLIFKEAKHNRYTFYSSDWKRKVASCTVLINSEDWRNYYKKYRSEVSKEIEKVVYRDIDRTKLELLDSFTVRLVEGSKLKPGKAKVSFIDLDEAETSDSVHAYRNDSQGAPSGKNGSSMIPTGSNTLIYSGDPHAKTPRIDGRKGRDGQTEDLLDKTWKLNDSVLSEDGSGKKSGIDKTVSLEDYLNYGSAPSETPSLESNKDISVTPDLTLEAPQAALACSKTGAEYKVYNNTTIGVNRKKKGVSAPDIALDVDDGFTYVSQEQGYFTADGSKWTFHHTGKHATQVCLSNDNNVALKENGSTCVLEDGATIVFTKAPSLVFQYKKEKEA